MENSFEELGVGDTLQLNHNIKYYLLEAARWGRILAIVGYIFCIIFMLLAIYFILGIGAEIGHNTQANIKFGMGLLYLVLSLIYIIPINYLHKFSDKTTHALLDKDFPVLETAFKNLKSMMRFSGIFTLVMIATYVAVILGTILFKAAF